MLAIRKPIQVGQLRGVGDDSAGGQGMPVTPGEASMKCHHRQRHRQRGNQSGRRSYRQTLPKRASAPGHSSTSARRMSAVATVVTGWFHSNPTLCFGRHVCFLSGSAQSGSQDHLGTLVRLIAKHAVQLRSVFQPSPVRYDNGRVKLLFLHPLHDRPDIAMHVRLPHG